MPDDATASGLQPGAIQSRLVLWAGLGTLLLLFLWLYARFAGRLYFVLDDYIETEFALARTWIQAIVDSFDGTINWSGYRPVTYAVRATLAHAFGLNSMWGYFAFSMGLLLANTLLTFHLVRKVGRSDLWAFVAAGVVLLLPAHNEAVLYMSANANLMALCLSLIALEAARRVWSESARHRLWMGVAWAAYLLAVLAYEVTLPLPVLILLAHWAVLQRGAGDAAPGRGLRASWPLYAGMAGAALLALGLRVWAGSGQIAAGRSDYGMSFSPGHLLQGYTLFLGQLVLLHSSAWLHTARFADLREWMAPTNPRALASMVLAASGTLATFVLAMRSRRELRACRTPAPALWVGWGVLWVLMLALPFAALSGRFPENRYTVIPSFGYGVAIAAGAAWLAGPLGRRGSLARVRQALAIGGVTALFTFYAFVNTSDVGEWERASLHARAFMTQAPALAPGLPMGAGVAQVGVPANVGGAFVFATGESFRSAMHLLYGGVEPVVSSDLWMRDVVATSYADNGAPAPLVGFGYDRIARQVALLDSVWVCGASCVGAPLLQPDNPSTSARWLYAQRYDESRPDDGGLGLLFTVGDDGAARAMQSCWAFFDTGQVRMDPTTFDEVTLQRRCAEAGETLLASGALRALATAPAD